MKVLNEVDALMYRFLKCTISLLVVLILITLNLSTVANGSYTERAVMSQPEPWLVESKLALKSLKTSQDTQDYKSTANQIKILGYHNLSEVEQKLLNIEKNHPGIAKVYDLGVLYPHKNGTPKRTVQNRSVWALKLSDNPTINESSEPEVFYMGLHHSREWITVEVLLYFIDYLVNNYQTNTTLNNIINNRELWIVPVVNPDGFYYSQYGRDDINKTNGNQWRKNCNETNGIPGFQDGNWATGDGVDPNRNYGYQWGYDDSGSSPNNASELYRGSAPFSEIETQLIRDLALARDFKLALSFHSYGELIIFPWAYDYLDTPHDGLYNVIAKNISQHNNYVYGNPKDGAIYLCNGECDDWLYHNRSVLSFTVEVGTRFIPYTNDILPICQENLEPCVLIAKIADDPYQVVHSGVRGKVKDTQGRPIQGVNITTTYAGEDRWVISNKTGHYSLHIPQGSYNINAVKAGFWTGLKGVGVVQDAFSVLDIVMEDIEPPVISKVWATVNDIVDNKFEIGTNIQLNVQEKNFETGLTGSITIRSNSTGYNSGSKPLNYDTGSDNYFYIWNTTTLTPAEDYIIEADLMDFDQNLDGNGSNDSGPDLVLQLVDDLAPIVSLVDSVVIDSTTGNVHDSDESYEIGDLVRVIVIEHYAEKWLNGTINIKSSFTDYDSDIQKLSFNVTTGYYFWDWDTAGLKPGSDYYVETTLFDNWGNFDDDGLENSPDITIILSDTTPPDIVAVDSYDYNNYDQNDEVYEIGTWVAILVKVKIYEPGISGNVRITSEATGFSILLTNIIYNPLKDHYFTLFNTSGLRNGNEYIVEVEISDKYMNFKPGGFNPTGPDLVLELIDSTPPVVSEVYSFVGSDFDNHYEIGSTVWLVINEAYSEMNLTGYVYIQNTELGYASGRIELIFDYNLQGYICFWDTTKINPGIYQVETSLSDQNNNTDTDGLYSGIDLNITMEDTTPPEVISVWSHVGIDNDNVYERGSVVYIIIEELNSEPNLVGTIQILSFSTGYNSGELSVSWDSKNHYYNFIWPTNALKPSDDYIVETTLTDKWKNSDSDGLAAKPDLRITLVDTQPPEQANGVSAEQDVLDKTKVTVRWDSAETNTKAVLYRNLVPYEDIDDLDNLEPLITISGRNYTDRLPNEPGVYYYLVLLMDESGNINKTITSANTATVTIPEPEDKDGNGDDTQFILFGTIFFWLIIIVVLVLIVVAIVILLRRRSGETSTGAQGNGPENGVEDWSRLQKLRKKAEMLRNEQNNVNVSKPLNEPLAWKAPEIYNADDDNIDEESVESDEEFEEDDSEFVEDNESDDEVWEEDSESGAKTDDGETWEEDSDDEGDEFEDVDSEEFEE